MRGWETAASRAKAATLTTLKRDPGKEKIGHHDRQMLIGYGKTRADQGAGPVTFGIDIGVIKMIIPHAAAVHGPDISPEHDKIRSPPLLPISHPEPHHTFCLNRVLPEPRFRLIRIAWRNGAWVRALSRFRKPGFADA